MNLPEQKQAFIPIYRRLFEQYKNAIITQQHHPGERIDSISEMQKRYDISRETAKLVLKRLADDGLIIQRAGKGSFVADLGPRKKKWGVIIPYFSAQIDELITSLRIEAKNQKRKMEYYIDYNNWQEEIRLVGSMINERYEAIIVFPTFDESKTASFYRSLVAGGSLVMLINHTMAGSYFTYVIQSYDLGVKRAVQFLQSRCTERIAFIKNDTWSGRNLVQEVMEETFKSFVGESDDVTKAVVINSIHTLTPDFLREQDIQGIFCCDDLDAVRIIGRLVEWDFKIPGDISLISYGNTELARYFSPKITSIDCHYPLMANRTAKIISDHLNGDDVTYCQYVIQPELIIRET
jgi:DNA-binding LacI/PurR family transcriptional regulator